MDTFELSFVGSPKGLMNYIKSKMFKCEDCQDTGFITKTQWSEIDGKDIDWEVVKWCPNCNG